MDFVRKLMNSVYKLMNSVLAGYAQRDCEHGGPAPGAPRAAASAGDDGRRSGWGGVAGVPADGGGCERRPGAAAELSRCDLPGAISTSRPFHSTLILDPF